MILSQRPKKATTNQIIYRVLWMYGQHAVENLQYPNICRLLTELEPSVRAVENHSDAESSGVAPYNNSWYKPLVLTDTEKHNLYCQLVMAIAATSTSEDSIHQCQPYVKRACAIVGYPAPCLTRLMPHCLGPMLLVQFGKKVQLHKRYKFCKFEI